MSKPRPWGSWFNIYSDRSVQLDVMAPLNEDVMFDLMAGVPYDNVAEPVMEAFGTYTSTYLWSWEEQDRGMWEAVTEWLKQNDHIPNWRRFLQRRT